MIRRIIFSSDESSDEERPQRRKVYKVRVNFDLGDDFSFKEAFRLSKLQVEYVLHIIGAQLSHNSEKNHALTAKEQLLLALRWMGNGAQMHGVSTMHGVNKATVCRTLHRVVSAIINTMLNTHVCWPNETQEIARKFYQRGGFPCVGGIVDGTLIKLDAPREHEENYIDRDGDHSLNIMVICGPDNYFYAVNACWPGSVHDSRVFRNTAVFNRFDGGWRPFPGAVILADSAYPMKDWIMPPIRRNPDNPVEVRFNRYHKKPDIL